jgi:hypothetical protein
MWVTRREKSMRESLDNGRGNSLLTFGAMRSKMAYRNESTWQSGCRNHTVLRLELGAKEIQECLESEILFFCLGIGLASLTRCQAGKSFQTALCQDKRTEFLFTRRLVYDDYQRATQ